MTWVGEVALRPGLLVFAGTIGPAAPHVHATATVLATAEPLRMSDASGATAAGRTAVVPSGVWHGIATGGRGVMVFLEPSSAASAAVRVRAQASGPVTAAASWFAPVAGAAVDLDGPATAVADRLLSALGLSAARADPGAEAALAGVAAAVARLLPGRVRLDDVAAQVHLSTSAVSRLVRRTLGLGFPAYVRWCRLQLAVAALRDGADLTTAAHAAGFADSAHANRVCHEMFGMAPRTATGGITWA